ncbi:MAG: hypothetical protein VKK42_29925 [Lyngbya sp.]|nr:hypothetical protein [Lyngbya sp.]
MLPRGTGKTTIEPAETLNLAIDGTVTSSIPSEISFKDAQGFKPVCPFFELHGEWSTQTGVKTGPITPQVLAKFGLTTKDLQWKVEVANLKPHHYTLEEGDRVAATVEITGDITQRQFLQGVSPQDAEQPLASPDKPVPLGRIQLTRPTDEFPEIRLRFTPAKGKVYGPTNLKERIENLNERLGEDSSWKDLKFPTENQILNPEAAWCKFVATNDDPRTNPGGLYATEDDTGVSLGLVDDVCDGVITCSLPGVSPAKARIVVGPPDYAPDRRPVTSLADGLSDRVKRDDVLEAGYVDDLELTATEVRDLLERVLETMEAMNLDYQNNRARGENRNIAREESLPPEAAANKAFPEMEPVLGRPLPLTEFGRQRHRRFISVEVFEDMLRERPELIDKWIRQPMTEEKYYDRKMPALMRGSDRYPMHITRRQYQLLKAWANRLRQDAESGT